MATSNPKPSLDNSLKRSMIQAANIWKDAAVKRAKTRKIAESFKVSKVDVVGSRYTVTISNNAPEAAAFEFGSGLHGRKHEKYPIVAHNPPPNLVFFWKRKGRWFVGPSVNHPGVKAEPALKPALEEVKDQIIALIGKDFMVNVVAKSIQETWYST